MKLSHFISRLCRACSFTDRNCVFRRMVFMEAKRTKSYEEAVCALNGLQSNAAYIKARMEKRLACPEMNLIDTTKYLNLLGIKVKDLNSLNVIHVSGTKGKGSTCAFTESILRHHGLKTGFYSSPHLISLTERIRINGAPINKDLFALYFWHVFDTLQNGLNANDKMPSYFMFLTIMAFYVFLQEKVDVAVIEVGIGGLFDCTNVVEKPVVVGVTTLGLDHVNMLGDTIGKIAVQKSGIFKPGVPAYTVPQEDGAIYVMQSQAQIKGCPLYISPPFDSYKHSCSLDFAHSGNVLDLNASLAVQLCKAFLDKKEQNGEKDDHNIIHLDTLSTVVPLAASFPLSPKFCIGLKSCVWPGRFQVLRRGKHTFYLDGAHTAQSMKCCVHWFRERSEEEAVQLSVPVCRVLLFNYTGERNPDSLLNPVSELFFDVALFSPNQLFLELDPSSDQSNFKVDPSAEVKRCETNQNIWCHLMRSYHENALEAASGSSMSFTSNTIHNGTYCDPENTLVFTCLTSALNFINGDFSCGSEAQNCLSSESEYSQLQEVLQKANHIQVLVTGSLYLVGNVLSVIDPDLKSATAVFKT